MSNVIVLDPPKRQWGTAIQPQAPLTRKPQRGA